MPLTVECEGRVTITVHPDPAPPPGGGTRTTHINCPTHGPRAFVETYDCESGCWGLATPPPTRATGE